jgi:poly(A) polymerase
MKLNAAWISAPATVRVMAALNGDAETDRARFVGGCVRNTILGQPVDDIDIATVLTPDQVIEAGRMARLGVHPTGLAHGTVTLVCDGQPFEVTTLRRDIETDGRHAVVAFTDDWNADAARRDFRLNALYASADGTLYDPTGEGLADARAGRVIFIGAPEDRIREDVLRILRFFRFSAWYARGPLDEAGLAACGALAAGLEQISVERIWKETKKLLSAADPRAALSGMARLGVMAELLPEFRIDTLSDARLEALVETDLEAFFAPDPMLRLMALLPRDPGLVSALARRLKLSNAERDRLDAWAKDDTEIVSYLSMRQVRRALYRLGALTFTDRVRTEWATQYRPRTVPQWRALLALAQSYERPVLPLTGEDVKGAGVAPGPQVGQALRAVEDWWIDADFTDDRLSIIERLKAVAQGLA